MSSTITVVVCQGRGNDPGRQELQNDLAAALALRPGVAVALLPHLIDLTDDGPGTRYLRSVHGDLIVLGWLYPRAAYWTLCARGITGRFGQPLGTEDDQPQPTGPATGAENAADRTIWCLDLRQHDRAEPCLDEIDRIAAAVRDPTGAADEPDRPAAPAEAARVEETARPRWYPVIDFTRCTNCLECLNFCLFGVYDLDEGESIVIKQPDACRTGCPACSRICPAAAIMFPQHKDPAIAGDATASLEGLKLDLSQLFGDFDPAELAASERDRAMAEQKHDAAAKRQPDRGKPAERDGLDDLVDELDELDL